MTPEDLDALERLDRQASSGPWYVRHLDDDYFMSAVAVSTCPPTGRSLETMEMVSGELVAACYVQHPPYVMPDAEADGEDSREDSNAALIAAVRNALPELIRLARQALSEPVQPTLSQIP